MPCCQGSPALPRDSVPDKLRALPKLWKLEAGCRDGFGYCLRRIRLIALSVVTPLIMDHTKFMQVFPAGAQLPYDRHLVADIESSRKTFEGTLFIDRVLRALGITKGKTDHE